MEIPEKLLKWKIHIFVAVSFSLLVFSLLYLAPSFSNILAYFWPLLVSTALFLVAVVVFGLTTPPGTEASGDKAGEGILDYVAGRPEQELPPTQIQDDDDDDEKEEEEEETQKSEE